MRVLFVCVENTCRSQIAEGFARSMGLEADSAGVRAGSAVNPDAVEVMSEIGIDISGQSSKSVDSLELGTYDTVVSMCSVDTADLCPATFMGTQANWNIEDPKGKSLDVFRRIRDLIEEKVKALAKPK